MGDACLNNIVGKTFHEFMYIHSTMKFVFFQFEVHSPISTLDGPKVRQFHLT